MVNLLKQNVEKYSFFDRDFYHTPVEVIDQMMQFSDVVGKVVLEPSAGSGSTLYAGKSLQRNVFGFEIKKDFFQQAKKALDSGVQAKLF